MKNKFEKETTKKLKYKSDGNSRYYLTIFDDSGLQVIDLEKFDKETINFGRNFANDIVIDSDVVDFKQGTIEITEYGILIKNLSDKNYILGKDNKCFNKFYLPEGGFAKILSKDLSSGVVFIMSISNNIDEWKQYTLTHGKITLGAGGDCDIILPQNGVANRHASINIKKDCYSIIDEKSINGTYINGIIIPKSVEKKINDCDVILIGNTKIVLYKGVLYYQILEKGIRLDAINIVKTVKVKLKTKTISSHINMTIKPSEFVAFVGGSGAGKTTFMKCISGVDKATSGTVLIDGVDLYENYETLKLDIGYVPQEDIVYSNLTLYDMLKYAAQLRMPELTSNKAIEIRIKEVLEIVQLIGFENTYIRKLSGGQRKRASIAVELLANPNLFFLDEPTSGLDPGTERSVMKTLRKMANMGKTIILVTHNTLNLNLCDKVAFFGEGGKLCFFGKPKEALEFFEVDDFVDIYTLLNDNTEKWHKRYEIGKMENEKNIEAIPRKENVTVPQKKHFLNQLLILIRRYIKLIANDYWQILLLFAQAPIIAYLLSLNVSDKVYVNYDDTKAIFFSLGCACIWLGLLNAIQEICKEKVILQKEYMANVKLSAYLCSKLIVQTILAFIQSFLMVYIFQKLSGKSEYNILGSSFWDIQIICFLTIVCSAVLGLFISSIVKNSNLAMSLAPLILVPQLLFSGMLFKLEGATDFISNFILCRWTVEGLGSSVNLNKLTHIIQIYMPMKEIEEEAYFLFTTEHMCEVIGIICLMTLVLMILSYLSLRKNVNKNL